MSQNVTHLAIFRSEGSENTLSRHENDHFRQNEAQMAKSPGPKDRECPPRQRRSSAADLITTL